MSGPGERDARGISAQRQGQMGAHGIGPEASHSPEEAGPHSIDLMTPRRNKLSLSKQALAVHPEALP